MKFKVYLKNYITIGSKTAHIRSLRASLRKCAHKHISLFLQHVCNTYSTVYYGAFLCCATKSGCSRNKKLLSISVYKLYKIMLTVTTERQATAKPSEQQQHEMHRLADASIVILSRICVVMEFFN